MNTLTTEVSMRRTLLALLPALAVACAACGGPASAGADAGVTAASGGQPPAAQPIGAPATPTPSAADAGSGAAATSASAWQPCAASIAAGQGIRAVSGSGASDLWAVGPAGMALHRTSDGWTAYCKAGGPALAAVWSAAANDAWMVGGATVLHWDGAAVSEVSAPAPAQPFTAVWGLGPADLWALSSAEVLHFDGRGWTRSTAADMRTLGFDFGAFRDVWGAGPGEVTIAAERGALRYDGTGWFASLAAPADQLISSTWSAGPGDGWAAGKNLDGGSALWRFSGNAWAQQAFVQRPVLDAVRGSSRTDLWFLSGSDLLHWDGAAVATVAAPAAPAGAPHVLGPAEIYLPDALGIARWDGAAWSRVLAK
ncbi:hypothetical protein [Anaeromyxobacter paludicola]|uniref:Uncharacterized protein n=1 Tax=Anaeromyxobacter paludicola TaxID=2918171 RepID=A0ABN6N831_9BACT|nr:hypothetical protein [Anaeromyxobacter paludicola]BDG09341.1 hypothetical protein AMPC_24540 [Anaeromyxobacter paludicola]